MATAKTKRPPGILAKLLRALGFRLVFPIGTLPVPYHPLVFPLALAALLGWIGWSAYDTLANPGEGDLWWRPIPVFIVLGLVLSVPIVAWLAMVLRLHLIQGLIGLSLPVLVSVELIAGTLPPAWGLLPVTYVGLFLFQLLYGPRWLARVERENAAFEPIEPGQATLALGWRVHQPEFDLVHSNVARIWARKLSGRKGWLVHRLSLEDADRLEAAAEGRLPQGWRISRYDGRATLERPCARRPADAIRVWDRRARSPLWAITGLREYGLRIDGRTLRLRFGTAQLVGRLPLFIGFHWTAIFGGKSQWQFGFPRVRAHPVKTEALRSGACLRTLIAPRPDDGGVTEKAQMDALLAQCEQWAAANRREAKALLARQGEFWAALPGFTAVPAEFKPIHRALSDPPDAPDPRTLPAVLDWLERCRDAPSQAGFYQACNLLETYPDEALTAGGERIAGIFNSRKVALQWNLAEMPDRSVLPDGTAICALNTAGFGLFRGMPGFYAMLEEVVPQMRGVTAGLDREYTDPEPGLRTKGVVRSL